MTIQLFWIKGPWPGKLAIVLRPRGGDWLADEIRSWQTGHLDVVVSLLTNDEIVDLGLTEEAKICETHGIQFHSFPIVDCGVPSSRKTALAFLRQIEGALVDGKCIGVHCRQGIGRSGLIAACLLILAGADPDKALQRVSAARGCPVPETPEQMQWIATFAKEGETPVSHERIP